MVVRSRDPSGKRVARSDTDDLPAGGVACSQYRAAVHTMVSGNHARTPERRLRHCRVPAAGRLAVSPFLIRRRRVRSRVHRSQYSSTFANAKGSGAFARNDASRSRTLVEGATKVFPLRVGERPVPALVRQQTYEQAFARHGASSTRRNWPWPTDACPCACAPTSGVPQPTLVVGLQSSMVTPVQAILWGSLDTQPRPTGKRRRAAVTNEW